jgi:hypothetical protein
LRQEAEYADRYSKYLTGEFDMEMEKTQNEYFIKTTGPQYNDLEQTAEESQLRQQREETIEWISKSALSRLSHVWQHAANGQNQYSQRQSIARP